MSKITRFTIDYYRYYRENQLLSLSLKNGLSVIPGLNENTVYIVLDGYIEAYIIVYFIFSRFNSRNVWITCISSKALVSNLLKGIKNITIGVQMLYLVLALQPCSPSNLIHIRFLFVETATVFVTLQHIYSIRFPHEVQTFCPFFISKLTCLNYIIKIQPKWSGPPASICFILKTNILKRW